MNRDDALKTVERMHCKMFALRNELCSQRLSMARKTGANLYEMDRTFELLDRMARTLVLVPMHFGGEK